MWRPVFYVILLLPFLHALTLQQYHEKRNRVKTRRSYGAEISLNNEELKAETILLQFKEVEIQQGIKNQFYPPAWNFFQTKKLIAQSQVFKIIKMMPKGAALHLHDLAMVDPDWLVKHLTYKGNCYVCVREKEIFAFAFLNTEPKMLDDCSWKLTSEVRREQGLEFDDLIIHHLTIEPENLYNFDACCVDQNHVWQRAERGFKLLADLLFVQPNLGEFWKQALTEFRNDGALWVEPRSLVFTTTDFDGNAYDPDHYLHVYKTINDQFVGKHSDFIGSKVIKCDIKFMDVNAVNQSLSLVMDLMKKYPDYLAGYDLVGQEDKSIPLEQYLDVLLRPSQMSPPVDVPYFFHAGETDWFDTVIDLNLLDAIMLNSSRIGHAYSLMKHPHLLKLVKESDIAVEVNPISNQVLGLVSDLRNHPVTYLLAENVSVVVSSDDPSIWRSLPLSHDFYALFMANTGMKDGLQVLKKLALNSINFSSMSSWQKERAFEVFEQQWSEFIQRVISEFS